MYKDESKWMTAVTWQLSTQMWQNVSGHYAANYFDRTRNEYFTIQL